MGLRPTRAGMKIQSLPLIRGEVRWGSSESFILTTENANPRALISPQLILMVRKLRLRRGLRSAIPKGQQKTSPMPWRTKQNSAALILEVRLDELADTLDSLSRLGQDRSEALPDMNHVRPDFQRSIDGRG